MKKIDELTLLSGNDIPFESIGISIHNPTLREIGMIGEDVFQVGSRFLVFDKNFLSEQDKKGLSNKSNFDIFIAVMGSTLKAEHKTFAKKVLELLFPGVNVSFKKGQFLLQNKENIAQITEQTYEEFRQLLTQIFCLESSQNYNTKSALAKKIADKIAKGKEKAAKLNGENESTNIYSKYALILSVGLQLDLNILMGYTIYQIRHAFKKFIDKANFDTYLQAKLAGATGMEEVDNWMETKGNDIS